jgi:ankyrin repeat protein
VLVNSISSTGDLEQLKQLKEEGVDFNCVDYRGRSALHIACLHGYMPVVQFLMKEAVNLDKIDSTGVSPLYHAILRGHENIAKLLHFKGASVHAPSEKLAKLLCICGFKGDTEKVKLLKDCEANIEVSDYDLRTVAHLAAAEGHWELLNYLIVETNFNFLLKDRWGKKPLEEIHDAEKRAEFEEALAFAREQHHHSPKKVSRVQD